MKGIVKGIASISVFALLGLAACAGGPEGADAAPAAGDEGPVGEASEALAGATTCAAFVQSHVNWMRGQNNCSYGAYTTYSIVSHQPSGSTTLAGGSFDQATEGFTVLNPFTQTWVTVPSTLSSNGTANGSQTFSNRTFFAKIVDETFTRLLKFDPRAAEQVKVTLDTSGKMVIRPVTSGGPDIVVQPTECLNNLMYGFGNGALYSISLTDACIPG